MREGCEGHEVALPLPVKYEQAKDCRSEQRSPKQPDPQRSKGHAQIILLRTIYFFTQYFFQNLGNKTIKDEHSKQILHNKKRKK